jgi:hypothetical protein
MNRKIDPAEIEKRIRAWAEVFNWKGISNLRFVICFSAAEV